MKTRIMSEDNLKNVLNENTVLSPDKWDEIKNKLRELGNEELKQFSNLTNPVIKLLSKQILLERGAIKINN